MPDLVGSWIAAHPYLHTETHRKWRLLGSQLVSLSQGDVIAYITAPDGKTGGQVANNTVRQRLSTVNSFVSWLRETDHAVSPNPLPKQTHDAVCRKYPKLYGKQQGKRPPHPLTHDEAFSQLLGACRDGTWIGSRDQLVIRFGLLGLRVAEIVALTWGDYADGQVRRRGKGNRIRHVIPGPDFARMLSIWRRQYEQAIGRPIVASDHLLCSRAAGNNQHATPVPAWEKPLTQWAVRRLLSRRAELARLGHVAPHDLRRTTGSILHNSKTADGAHLYDLLDIQRALDHVDPATTQRSYIDPFDTGDVKRRAGITLD